jgi:hypothetical protein
MQWVETTQQGQPNVMQREEQGGGAIALKDV